jgi:hypothetical protein
MQVGLYHHLFPDAPLVVSEAFPGGLCLLITHQEDLGCLDVKIERFHL